MSKEKRVSDIAADVVVVGTGSGALLCAISAAERGAKVVVVERAAIVGGGTAYSGGLVWIPNNHHEAKLGLNDSRDEAITHLRRISGGKHDEEVMLAFVDKGPEAIRFIEQHAGFTFEVVRGYPDYNAELPGGKMEGRYLQPPLFEAQQLGPWQDKLVSSPHMNFPSNFGEVGRWGGRDNFRNFDWELIGQRVKDDVRGWGAAYSGYLLKACLDRKIDIFLDTRATRLLQDSAGRVIAIEASADGGTRTIGASRGVLLGCGGYEWNEEMKKRMPWPAFVGLSVPTNQGDGIAMGVSLGAATAMLGEGLGCALRIPGEEHMGMPLYRMLTSQAGTPGTIIVNKAGRRFSNESFWMSIDEGLRSYDSLTQSYANLPAYMIFDQWHKDNYPVGTTPPWEGAPSWLPRGNTLGELAGQLGIDAPGLEQTVAAFNRHARDGEDPEFLRGARAFDKANGDKSRKGNPCLAPLEQPPYYAMEVFYASAGTRSGLAINGKAQVMKGDGAAISGLYACANTAAHLACGTGYSSGLTIAQSTVFGYIASLEMMGAH